NSINNELFFVSINSGKAQIEYIKVRINVERTSPQRSSRYVPKDKATGLLDDRGYPFVEQREQKCYAPQPCAILKKY
ncbi:MAG TPA: hypothetical protein PLP19_19985, partial [bacterium]|nr:hypothetical protein [bacterium]HPN45776.1 hypothetical protein [bacterium]